MVQCNLCGSESVTLIGGDRRRLFYLCGECELVSVPPEYWLSVEDERARYDLHDNNLSNGGYVKFLSRVADTAARVVDEMGQTPPRKVLDFGCGKEAAACRLLNDRGIDCYGYDPLFGRPLPNPASKPEQYDIVILCEVIEHLRDIKSESALVSGLLRGGGAVILRTRIYESPSSFPNWWYAQDSTHINFFSEKSLSVAGEMMGKRVEKTEFSDILVLRPK